jgi:hypothetical protein
MGALEIKRALEEARVEPQYDVLMIGSDELLV